MFNNNDKFKFQNEDFCYENFDSINEENKSTSNELNICQNEENYKDKNKNKDKDNCFKKAVTKIKEKYYFGYYTRLVIFLFLLFLLLFLTIIFVLNIFDISKENYFNYSESSNVDYRVYLKDNNFYESDYLTKDRVYVASLIDKINIDFNYKFISEKNIDALFKYNVTAKLLITDFNDKNIYYEKEYVLLSDKDIKLDNKKSRTILETVSVDYDQYNRIANNFKNSYALSTKSKLIIYFNIEKQITNKENAFVDNKKNNMYLEIPLSEKSVEIELNSNDINNDNKILLNKSSEIKINKIYIVLSLITVILFIIVILKVIKYIKYLLITDNGYDAYIKKILNEYDRLIVKTKTPPVKVESDKENIISVESFEELLDVRDNLKQPIMYYVITEHIKCQFYIKSENKIYLTTIKSVDLEDRYEKI